MIEYLGMSKPKKYANKVELVLTQESSVSYLNKINQTTSIYLYINTYIAK